MKLYHATFNAYMDSIKKNGLIVGAHKNWSMSHMVIYLTDDLDVAGSFCETNEDVDEEILDSGISILEVDSEDLDMEYLMPDRNWRRDEDWEAMCYEYYLPIPFENLKIVETNY